jgi:hypothetical protein
MEKQDEVKEKKSTAFVMSFNENSHNENASLKSTIPYLVPERKLPIFPISAASSNFIPPEAD